MTIDQTKATTLRGFDTVLAHRRVTDYGIEIIPVQGYRSPAWHRARMHSVSASEIAALLGISPYTSAFDLWWAKKNGEYGQEENEAMRRGRRVEPLVIEDFDERHPEFHVLHVGLIANVLRGWQVCTPDGLVTETYTERTRRWKSGDAITATPEAVAVLEAKTAGSGEGWGDEGTDQIPVHYRAQVQWQMDVTGLRVAYLPVWVGYSYKEYVVEYDEADCLFMRDKAREFLTSLERNEAPEVDGHSATAARLKKLHPSVIPGAVEVPETLIRQYQLAKRLEDAAGARRRLAENRIRAAIGDFKEARVGRRKVASRSVYDVKESVRHFPAYTVNRLTIPKDKA